MKRWINISHNQTHPHTGTCTPPLPGLRFHRITRIGYTALCVIRWVTWLLLLCAMYTDQSVSSHSSRDKSKQWTVFGSGVSTTLVIFVHQHQHFQKETESRWKYSNGGEQCSPAANTRWGAEENAKIEPRSSSLRSLNLLENPGLSSGPDEALKVMAKNTL